MTRLAVNRADFIGIRQFRDGTILKTGLQQVVSYELQHRENFPTRACSSDGSDAQSTFTAYSAPQHAQLHTTHPRIVTRAVYL
jgi:hypothetical protein